MEIINTLAFIGLGSLSLVFFMLGIKLLRSDGSVYQSNRSYNSNVLAALKGVVNTPREGARDFRCAAGMVYNKKSKKIIFQGKLSDEAVQDIIR